MDSLNDFVVIEEEESCSQKSMVDRLSVLVDLFSKALDAVNQSNVLLKDELRSALSVTLQNIGPDTSASTESLVKALESNVTSTDDIRSNYTRNLCSRLVAVNEQNENLLAELSSLKQSVLSKDKDHQDQLRTVSATVDKIYEVLLQLDSHESSESNSTGIAIQSLDELTIALNDINDRLTRIHLMMKQLQETQASTLQSVTTSTVETGVVTGPLQSEIGSQTDDLPSSVPTLIQQDPDVAERSVPYEPHVRSETPSPSPTQTRPKPTFCAEEEEPLCPCCGERFNSRYEFETHLEICLMLPSTHRAADF